MIWMFLVTFTFFSVVVIKSQYVPPEATVLPLHPIGIKISIPDEEGISLVAYHVKFNKEFYGLEAGTIARDITKPKDGKWTYEDRSTKLKEGDVIYYWVHVVFEGLGYNLLEQQHVVNDFYDYKGNRIGGTTTGDDFTGNATCAGTLTKVFDKSGQRQSICGGDLIFEETFDSGNQINNSKWNTIEQFSGPPDYEFVVYRNDKENVKIENGNLKITPTLLDNTCGSHFVENGTLILNKCTGKLGTRECQRKAQGFLILPPIVSGRINTKNLFSFQYGRIVIKAKMPRGDWIYPLLWLEPMDEESLAGNDLTVHFQLRIASSLGNSELQSSKGEDLSGHILRGGFLYHNVLHKTDITTLETNDRTKNTTSNKLWSNEFHLFEMEWKPESIISKVDGEIFGEVNIDKPLQTPFYITLGVAAGGYTEFPDGCKNKDYVKPWSNFKSKALLNFYRKQSTWLNAWRSGPSLKVDFVKVWAL